MRGRWITAGGATHKSSDCYRMRVKYVEKTLDIAYLSVLHSVSPPPVKTPQVTALGYPTWMSSSWSANAPRAVR